MDRSSLELFTKPKGLDGRRKPLCVVGKAVGWLAGNEVKTTRDTTDFNRALEHHRLSYLLGIVATRTGLLPARPT